MGCIVLETVI
jgi:hypothetical protein